MISEQRTSLLELDGSGALTCCVLGGTAVLVPSLIVGGDHMQGRNPFLALDAAACWSPPCLAPPPRAHQRLASGGVSASLNRGPAQGKSHILALDGDGLVEPRPPPCCKGAAMSYVSEVYEILQQRGTLV
jgi:hypothetical protein